MAFVGVRFVGAAALALAGLLAGDAPTAGDARHLPAKAALLTEKQLSLGPHHLCHAEAFGAGVPAANLAVLRGIDVVQARAPSGGGYFAERGAVPPESAVGCELRLFGGSLIVPTRTSSYCSGATYAAFVEALNLLFPEGARRLSPERLELMRMQEPDGRHRDDYVKFWGKWNSQWGHDLALVHYSAMGQEICAADALPGDFLNLAWARGLGHAAVFLGWTEREGEAQVLFWSSQHKTEGFGDRLELLSSIKEMRFVRLTDPERIFTFEPAAD